MSTYNFILSSLESEVKNHSPDIKESLSSKLASASIDDVRSTIELFKLISNSLFFSKLSELDKYTHRILQSMEPDWIKVFCLTLNKEIATIVATSCLYKKEFEISSQPLNFQITK